MPKKSPKKSKKPAKVAIGSKKPKLITSVLLVAVFAFAGAWSLSQSFAAKPVNYNTDPNAVVVDIRVESPPKIENIQQLPASVALRLYGNGDLVCGQNNGSYTYASLPEGKVSSLLNRLTDTGITKTPARVSGTADTGVSDYMSVFIKTSESETTNTYYDGAKPTEYDKVQSVVKSTCASAIAALPASRVFDPAPLGKTLEPVKDESPTAMLRNFIEPKAHALTIYRQSNPEFDQLTRINNARASAGKSALLYSDCLNKVAAAQAQRMASTSTLYHNPSLASNVTSTCGNWRWVGENVGYTGGCDYEGYDDCSSRLFGAFMNSAGHKANILDSDYDYVGVGSYRTSSGYLWVAQVYGTCISSCGMSTGAPRVVGTNYSPLAGNSQIKRGTKFTVRTGYQNQTARGWLGGTVRLQSVYPDAFVSLVSAQNPYNSYKTQNATRGTASGGHEVYNKSAVTYWLFSKVPPKDYNAYDQWTDTITLQVKSTAPTGKFCVHTDVWGGNQAVNSSGRYCYYVIN